MLSHCGDPRPKNINTKGPKNRQQSRIRKQGTGLNRFRRTIRWGPNHGPGKSYCTVSPLWPEEVDWERGSQSGGGPPRNHSVRSTDYKAGASLGQTDSQSLLEVRVSGWLRHRHSLWCVYVYVYAYLGCILGRWVLVSRVGGGVWTI